MPVPSRKHITTHWNVARLPVATAICYLYRNPNCVLHHSISFSVSITDAPFTGPSGNIYDQTAEVSFLDANHKVFDMMELGVVDKALLYDKISKGETLTLHHCYVAEFSLDEYRKQRGLSNVEELNLPDFSATHCFFDNHASIDLSYTVVSGRTGNFSNSIFRSDVNFLRARFTCSSIDFSRVRFHGNANFQYAELAGGDSSFAGAVFEGEHVSFLNADMSNGQCDFSNTQFHATEVNFQYARFRDGDLSFDRANFNSSKLVFAKCEFGNGKVDFRLVHFGNADVDFSESEFAKGKVRFRRSHFGNGHISFEGADFGSCDASFERSEFGSGNLSFHRAQGRSLLLNGCHFSGLLDLRVESFERIDLSDTTNRDLIDLNTDQARVAIQQMNLSGMRNLGRIAIDWLDNNVPSLIYGQTNTTIKQKSDQFRLLKEEFHQAGQYNDEDLAYVHFKRLEWRHETARMLGRAKQPKPLILAQQWFKKLVFDWVGHYATNPIRVLNSMVIAFVIFAFLFVGLEVSGLGGIDSSLGDPDGLNMIEKAFYHSAITFLTIGYGDYYPSGLARPLSGLEGFVGLFLLSYFTVAFVRKILR